MANSVNVCETILDKKLDGYGTNMQDYKASGELTVEVTLSEYRQLVKDCVTASSRNEELKRLKYERETENKNLLGQVNALKAENYELKKALEGKDGTKQEDKANE